MRSFYRRNKKVSEFSFLQDDQSVTPENGIVILWRNAMRCFLVEIRFLKPFSDFGDAVARHRAYLQQGYDQGMLLLSGPKDDRSAGICIARADDEAAIRAFFDQDPYRLEKLAEHVIIAFTAAKYQSFLETWINPV